MEEQPRCFWGEQSSSGNQRLDQPKGEWGDRQGKAKGSCVPGLGPMPPGPSPPPRGASTARPPRSLRRPTSAADESSFSGRRSWPCPRPAALGILRRPLRPSRSPTIPHDTAPRTPRRFRARDSRESASRAPHPPLPRPAPPERIARAAAGTRCPPPAAHAPPPCPQGGLRAGPLPRAPSGGGAMDAAPCSFQKPCLQGAQSRRLQPRADYAEANAAELCWAGRG